MHETKTKTPTIQSSMDLLAGFEFICIFRLVFEKSFIIRLSMCLFIHFPWSAAKCDWAFSFLLWREFSLKEITIKNSSEFSLKKQLKIISQGDHNQKQLRILSQRYHHEKQFRILSTKQLRILSKTAQNSLSKRSPSKTAQANFYQIQWIRLSQFCNLKYLC